LEKKKNFLLARICFLEACIESQNLGKSNNDDDDDEGSKKWKFDALRGLSKTNRRFSGTDSFSLAIPRWKEKKEKMLDEASKIDTFLWKMDNFRIVADVTTSVYSTQYYPSPKTKKAEGQLSSSLPPPLSPPFLHSSSTQNEVVPASPSILSSILSKLEPYLETKEPQKIVRVLKEELISFPSSELSEYMRTNVLEGLNFSIRLGLSLYDGYSLDLSHQFEGEIRFVSSTTDGCMSSDVLQRLLPELFTACSPWAWFFGRVMSNHLGMDFGLAFYELAVNLILHPEAKMNSLVRKFLFIFFLLSSVPLVLTFFLKGSSNHQSVSY
jgi:hypothetical protein